MLQQDIQSVPLQCMDSKSCDVVGYQEVVSGMP